MLKGICFSILVFICSSLNSQQLSGKVVDSESGESLPYASVYFKKAFQGGLTNLEGDFSLNVAADSLMEDTFVVSLIGYESYKKAFSEMEFPANVELVSKMYDLKEVVVLPKPAEYYVRRAGEKIPENFSKDPFNSTIYYRELLRENGQFSHFLEAILGAYNRPYSDTTDTNHLSILAGKKIEDVKEIQFMRKNIEKYEKKERKKAQKKGEEFDDEEDGFQISMGNPVLLFNYNMLRTRRLIFSPENIPKYEYKMEGVVKHEGMNLLVISFDQRSHVKEALFKGKLYLEEESLAIVSIEYSYSEKGMKYIIPGKVDAVMFLIGLKVEGPFLDVTIRCKELDGVWVLEDILVKAKARLEKRRMFSENEVSQFEAEIFLTVLDRDFNEVRKIGKERRVSLKPSFKKQVEHQPNHPLWSRFTIMKPERFMEQLDR